MKKISFLFIVTFFFAAISPTVKAQINTQDSLALVALYDSTGGANWGINNNWLTKAPVSTWWGIGVDSNNRVDSIELSYNGLVGTIPSSIVNLTQIRYLTLDGNSLTGMIPTSIGNLTYLQVFLLEYNQLSGSIPTSIGNLTNLLHLSFAANQLTGSIPTSVGNLTNLRNMYLYGNQLSDSIPSSIGNMTNIKDLELNNNKLTGSIPASMNNLTNLVDLFLYNNQLSGTIPSLSNLTKLYEGVISTNKFTFAGMEAIAQNKAYTVGGVSRYSPQATVPLLQKGDTLSVSVGGTPANDTFRWYNSGKLIATIKSDSTYRPTSNGLYYVAATNAIATQLTLHSDSIVINYPTNPQDSLALVDLYNSTGGKNWANHTNWLTKLPVSSWYGVTEYNWRVTGIALDSNNLKGAIPSSLDSLPYLASLALNKDQLTFSGVEGISTKYSFATYAPQATVPLFQNGDTLLVSVGGTPSNDTFRWYKDSVLVATKVGDSNYTFTSNGKYWVVATNSIATELTLYSDTITIAGLPIKDITLSAKETNGQVLLQWQTIGEQNTASFTIQRSTDCKTFTDLTTKEAVGNGDNGYSYMDVSAASGVNYYRIRVTDKDGATSFSKVVSASLTIHDSQLTIYPNPAKDNVTISGNHIASVQVIDNMGRVVKVVLLKDATNPSLSVNSLPAGVYHLRIQTTDGGVIGAGLVKE